MLRLGLSPDRRDCHSHRILPSFIELSAVPANIIISDPSPEHNLPILSGRTKFTDCLKIEFVVCLKGPWILSGNGGHYAVEVRGHYCFGLLVQSTKHAISSEVFVDTPDP